MPDETPRARPSSARWTPSPRELADLELVSIGAWPAAEAYTVSVSATIAAADTVELLDPEGLRLARMSVHHREPTGDTSAEGRVVVSGDVDVLAHAEHGPFRRYHRGPAQIRAYHPGARAAVVRAPLTVTDLAALTSTSGTRVLLVATGPGSPRGVSGPGLVRATLAAVGGLADAAEIVVVAVSLAARGSEAEDRRFADEVAHAFADDVLALDHAGEVDPAARAVAEADRPPLDHRGLVVFFTGLSGSGKSTLARALYDVVLERGDRTVTSLDGDVVRHHLSKGLGFSKEDRETNIARIGWVAAEISRHHGLAICSPIAPFDATRALVRQMVEDAGGSFALVHVATPLAECERRDRKGLYAKARAGEIPEFTGISSPYEEPGDALVRVDTTGRTIEDALGDVLEALVGAGVWSTA